MRSVFLFVLLLSVAPMQARLAFVAAAGDPPAAQRSNDDTTEIKPGVIVVKKPKLTPYVKVEYKLYLSQVKNVQVPVQVWNGLSMETQTKTVPVFDSARYHNEEYQPVYPLKLASFSKYFSENMLYTYVPPDTPRIDTMYVGLEILKSGKIKWVGADTSYVGNMPQEMIAELATIANSLEGTDWGKGGGYKTRKRLFKPSQQLAEEYYCELYVIVSSMPLTVEQKRTGTAFAPFDIPLNSPPADAQQESFIRQNTPQPKEGQ